MNDPAMADSVVSVGNDGNIDEISFRKTLAAFG